MYGRDRRVVVPHLPGQYRGTERKAVRTALGRITHSWPRRQRCREVYRVPTGHGRRLTLYSYVGCTFGIAKSRLLASRAFSGDSFDPGTESQLQDRPFSCGGTDCTWVRGIRLAGTKVGIIAEDYGLDSTNTTLTVRDLANGSVLHTVQTYSLSIWVGEESIKYVLARSGPVRVHDGSRAARRSRHA